MCKSTISVFMSIFFTVLFLNTQSHAATKDGLLFNPVPVSVYTDNASGGGVPVGTIIAWPVTKNPNDWDKWLECNGQSITSTAYPELYALVGSKVPDYRGLFLRGTGGNAAAIGVQQNDLVGYHSHKIKIWGSGDAGWPDNNFAMGSQWWTWDIGHIEVNPDIGMGNETRPVNKAVRYLIRAKS